jgi:hypothetical protein
MPNETPEVSVVAPVVETPVVAAQVEAVSQDASVAENAVENAPVAVAEAKPEVNAPGFRTRSPGMLSPAGENNTGFAAAPVREPPSVEEQKRMTAEYQEKSKAAAPDLYAPLTDEERAARAREFLVGGLQEETAPARPGGIGLRASSDKASSNEQQKTDTRVKSIGDFLSGRRRAPRAPAALSARTGGNTGVPNAPVKSNFDKSVLPEAEDLP